jgi:hypothetical protein
MAIRLSGRGGPDGVEPYGLGVVFDPQRARNGITLISQLFAFISIASESTAFGGGGRREG